MTDEIIEVENNNLPVLAGNDLIAIADQAEKRIDAINKIKKIALKVTNKYDWVDENGKPYLQASGAEKVGRMFGISWRIDPPEKTQLDGGHYMYSYKGFFSLAGSEIEAIGTRSSKDGFFKKYSWENGEKTELPPSEISEGNVKKSAYTNCIANGVTRLLGIRNLKWEEVEQYSGVKRGDSSSVEYGSKNKKGGDKPPSSGPEKLTEPQRKKLWAMSMNKEGVSENDVKDFHKWLLEKYNVVETDGKQSLAKAAATEIINQFDKVFSDWIESKLST